MGQIKIILNVNEATLCALYEIIYLLTYLLKLKLIPALAVHWFDVFEFMATSWPTLNDDRFLLMILSR